MFYYLRTHTVIVKRFFVNELSWYLFGQILVQASSFVSAIIVSRYLGPTNLGLFSFSQNFVTLILSIIAGADFYLSWKIATSKDFRNELQMAFAYKIRLHGFLAIVGSIVALVTLPRDVALLCIVLFTPSLLQSFSIFTFYALSKNYAKQIGIIQAFLAFFFLATKLVGVYLGLPLTYFVIIASLDMVMFGILMYFYCATHDREIQSFFKGLPPVSFTDLLSFCLKISVSIIAIFFWGLLLRVDQFLLALFTNAYTLGLYAGAVKVAEMPNILAGVITSALTSRIALLPSIEKTKLRKRVMGIVFAQGLFGVMVMLFLIVFSGPIISLIYGPTFAGSEMMLRLYALTIPFIFINYVFHSIYGSFSLIRFQAINYGTAVVLNIVFGSLGFMLCGVTGVIYATILAYACSTIFSFFYFRRTILR